MRVTRTTKPIASTVEPKKRITKRKSALKKSKLGADFVADTKKAETCKDSDSALTNIPSESDSKKTVTFASARRRPASIRPVKRRLPVPVPARTRTVEKRGGQKDRVNRVDRAIVSLSPAELGVLRFRLSRIEKDIEYVKSRL